MGKRTLPTKICKCVPYALETRAAMGGTSDINGVISPISFFVRKLRNASRNSVERDLLEDRGKKCF